MAQFDPIVVLSENQTSRVVDDLAIWQSSRMTSRSGELNSLLALMLTL